MRRTALMPLVLDDRTQVARKAHRCDFCNRRIQPGETYRRQRGIADDPYVFKECAHCDAMVRLYNLWELGDWDYGLDRYDLNDCWEPTDETAREIKRRWLAGWREPNSTVLYPVPVAVGHA